MFSIFDLEKELKKIVPKGNLELPLVKKFGHISFNGLMIDRRQETKDRVINAINQCEIIEKYEIVGNGFLNIFIKNNIDFNINNTNFGNNQKINLEYLSPNPTGDLHLGHCRNAIIGAALYEFLKLCGFNVIGECYINDQGNQMEQFLETVKHHFYKIKNQPFHMYNIFYKGDYVEDIAKEIKSDCVTKQEVLDIIMCKINQTLEKMDIQFDQISFESNMYEDLDKIVDILHQKNLLYVGTMENQKTEGNQLILKTSEIGLDQDSVIKRSNGIATYYAFDLAYHYNKFKRNFDRYILILGEDHAFHIDKLTIVLKNAIDLKLETLKYNMFHLIKENEIIQMSKRNGTILTVSEILNKIDLYYLKWIMLSHSVSKTIYFDIDNVSIENPIFDLKYVYMRLNQLETSEDVKNQDMEDIFRLCFFWPIELRNALNNLDLHRILQYSFNLLSHLKEFLNNIIGNKISTKNDILLKKSRFILEFTIKILKIKQ